MTFNPKGLWYFLLVLPATIVGFFIATLFLGIAPTLMMDSFIPDFHYSDAARTWERYAGVIGICAGLHVGLGAGILETFFHGKWRRR